MRCVSTAVRRCFRKLSSRFPITLYVRIVPHPVSENNQPKKWICPDWLAEAHGPVGEGFPLNKVRLLLARRRGKGGRFCLGIYRCPLYYRRILTRERHAQSREFCQGK